jgi:hypothetical protein
MHPLIGTWTANIAKSRRRDPNHQFHRVTLRLEVEGDRVSLRYGRVNAAGRTEEGTRLICADGEPHPEADAPGVVSTSTIDTRTLLMVATKDGALVGKGSYETSEDGRTLTATTSGFDASGKLFEQVIVFDRNKGGGVTGIRASLLTMLRSHILPSR